MKISIPKLSLVVLVGPSGSGKSTFARKHFLPTEILSSDACRAMVSDDENNQAVTNEAFALLHTVAAQRLALGRLTVIDATSVQPEARAPLVALARKYHCLPVAVVLNLPEEVCHERNRSRSDRSFGPHVIRNQRSQLRRSLRGLQREGFRHVFVLESPEAVEAAVVERVPLWNDRTHEHGPFDIIGDVHGCADELEQLLERLGYGKIVIAGHEPGWSNVGYVHPEGRKAVFVGDLVDRGPRVLDTLSIARNMVTFGSALCVPGNHDMKLLKKLNGRDVQITHGLAESLAEIDALPDDVRTPFTKSLAEFLDGLVSHYVLDGGKLVVAHAGMKAEMQGRGSGKVRDFALYGETTGETDEFGLPVRYNWAAEYRGSAMVVYGHTPVPEAEWLNRTINIDTGCVFGGKLTALRYPEKEFVSVPAARTYCEPARPFLPDDQQAPKLTAQQADDEVLDADDVLGKRIVSTRLRGNVTIREAHATAALEVMSRFAANPKWLIYLPPTMSPCETSGEPGLLEHPAEAFAYFRNQGAPQVVCEEKHMGSRAVVIVCRDEQAARERFGVLEGEIGIVTTRTGRRFFNDSALESQFLDRVRSALTAADLWTTLNTTWGVPRLRVDAVVGQGAGTSEDPVRSGRCGRAGGVATGGRFTGSDDRAVERGRSRQGRTGDDREPTPGGARRPVRRRLPAVLLDGELAHRLEAGPVPRAGVRGPGPHGQEAHMAHGHAGVRLPHGPRIAAGDELQAGGRDRRSKRGGWNSVVDGTYRSGWRRNGGQAAGLHPAGQAGPRPARREVPGAGVPADHLRPGLHHRREPVPPAEPGARPQAVARPRRVRPRGRGAGAIRPPRTAAPCA